jgi:molybdate transport system substrate-binding protein
VTVALNVLCAGAVRGLVLALQARFEADAGVRLDATFGAVGAMRDAMRGGAPCDVLIVSDRLVEGLTASGELRAGSASRIGVVQTAIAVKAGAPRPAIATAAALKASLRAARALYFPDATLSTAGAHVASMLEALAIRAELEPRLRMFANGATAMRELAADPRDGAIGCTQATEIRYTPGLDLVGALPEPFALATVYAAALSSQARELELGARFVALLSGPESAALRGSGGFDPEPALSSPDSPAQRTG